MKLKNVIFLFVLFSLAGIGKNTVFVETQIMQDTVVVAHTDLDKFMQQMSQIESDNKLDAVNHIGMLGKYQFSPRTIKGLGINVTKEEFLNNAELQDSAMVALLRQNKRALRAVIEKYSGKFVNNVYVTEAGILAGAHLVGPGGVLAFFYPEKYSHNTVDGNGTSVVYYMNKFARYEIEL